MRRLPASQAPEYHPSPSGTDRERQGRPLAVPGYALGPLLACHPAADAFHATRALGGAPRVLHVVRPEAMGDPALLRRIVDEIEGARRLRRLAIPVVDVPGETADGRLFVAVEWRAGQSLESVVAERGPLGIESLRRVVTSVAEALEEAHALGLVHGQLTPDRILVDVGGPVGGEGVAVLGFGTGALTAEEIGPDDVPYLSPERIEGDGTTIASDVFGLASIVHLALHGAPPPPPWLVARSAPAGRGEDGSGLGDAAVDVTSIPGVLARARSLDPERRHPTIGALLDELGPLSPVERPMRSTGSAPTRRAPRPAAPSRWASRSPALREAGIHAAVVGLTAITVLLSLRYWTSDALVVERWTVTAPRARGAGDAAPVPTDGVPRRSGATTPATPRVGPEPGATPPAVGPLPSLPEVVEVPVAAVPADSGEPRRYDPVRPQEFARVELGRERPDSDHRGPDLAALTAARREAERAVEGFAGALRARDVAALERAAPDMPAVERAQWARVFGEASAVDAQLTVTDVRLDGDVIVASVRSRIDVRVRGVRTPMRSETVSTATLVRDSSGWRLRVLR